MFELELVNNEEIMIKTKTKTVKVNVAQSTIDADLRVGKIGGAGEFEIGDIYIVGTALKKGGVMYRVQAEGISLGIVGESAESQDLDDLGPVDILAASEAKFVPIVEPKILIPMGKMDFSEIKASVKVAERLKIKNAAALPASLEIYKLD